MDDNKTNDQVGWMKLYGSFREWYHGEGNPVAFEQSGFISCAEIKAMPPEERKRLGMEAMYRQCVEDE